MSRMRGQTYASSLHYFFFAVGSDVSIQGADGSRYQSIYELTEPSQAMITDDVSDEDRSQRLLHSE